MSEQTDTLNALLVPYGLTFEESKVYLQLAQKGVLTALKISREVHLARTKVYRILDRLIEKKMVIVVIDEVGKKFQASSYQELGLLVREKEAEVERLKKQLPETMAKLASFWGSEATSSKVLFYQGVDGLKQIAWNSLNADKELWIFEKDTMNAYMDQEYAEKMREEFVAHNIFTHQLTNLKHIGPYTKNAQLVKNCEIRYVDPKDLKLEFEVLIYNDVVAMYNYDEKGAFCVEIYNAELARMQKQLFQFVWGKAKKMKLLNEQGEVVV